MEKPADEIEKNLLSIVRGFLAEFKSERALSHVQLSASLERDLGIDSLGKVELFLRIEKAFSVRFPDSLMADAENLNDIAIAIHHAGPTPQIIAHDFATPLKETHFDPLSSKSLVEVLFRRVEEDPNRPHIYLQDEQGQEEIIRYGQLLERSTLVAGGLIEQGLKTGETVAIMLPTGAEFFYAFFGVLLAGGIPVPIYPPLRADKIEEYAVREAVILNNAEVRILITFTKVETLGKLLRVFIKSLQTVTTVELLSSSKKRPPRVSIHTEDAALIQYTSGSTSAPKGVLLSHHNLLSNIRAFGKAANLGPTDVGVSWLPLYHDMGLIGAWLGSLYHAFPLTLLSPLSFLNRPERWLWAIHYHRGTLSAGPNFAYELCVRKIDESMIEGLDLSSWRLAFNGAEAINPKTLARFIKKFKPYGFRAETVFPVYGLAESTVALTFPPLNRLLKIDTIAREPFETEKRAVPASASLTASDTLEFVSCGAPLPEHEIRVVNEENQELGERMVGSLHFNGPSAMQGYYQNLEATQAVYREGWWDTGDYAYIAEGEVYITGRKKDVIIKAGRNIYPQEIEEATAQVSGVRKGCVVAFGVQDPSFGTEKLVIVAETSETKTGLRNRMSDEIIEKVSDVLGIPPDEVVLVSPRTIPKTSSGKLQRSLCKQYYQEGKLSRNQLPFILQMTRLFLKGGWLSIGRKIKKLACILYTGYIGLLSLLFLPLVWMCISVFSRALACKCVKNLSRIFLLFAGFPIRIEGLKNITLAKPMIFVANHASYIDSLILVAFLPADIAFVAKQEVRNWPIIGKVVRKLGYLTVDRMDFAKSLSDSNAIVETLKEGRSVVIFPEGTFSFAPGLRPFKLGAFKIAVDTHTMICPIALQGTRPVLRGESFILTPTPIKMTIGEPLMPLQDNWNEVTRLHSLARMMIVKHCGELAIDLVAAVPVRTHELPPTH
jgi:1-acyl-sn-glycerol-3-phosphate acyltransferase